ncbi:hypothetical protein FHL15_004573 [Xylaria flabelliformis]|uniref:Uncharacterized protein n=1 Tax=Xylaria flabelliformis TaxID=2512241 RepID=A0A553I2I8_9PEZI|nr:hypothetical protein FHL15_004573 [Xylaria flabelliformis]
MEHITLEVRHGDLGFFDHSLAKRGTKIEVYVKILEIETGTRLDRSKTIGTITTKNSGNIIMTAHSGYTTGPKREEDCLDTYKWNRLALRFQFPKNIRDNSGHPILEEQRGRAHAGHVEVLLASWFVIHLLRREFDSSDKSEEHLITQLRRLKEIDLGDLRTSFITIDSEPCRTCLQFINRLSQYTGILFMVSGSRGMGPVKVRVDGQRRLDVVADCFSDSENETPDHEANTQEEEANETTPVEETAMPNILIPATQARSVRPRSSMGKAPQWTPPNPDEAVSSYKKKTPQWEHPDYEGKPRRNPATPSHVDEYWKIHSPGSRVQASSSNPIVIPSTEESEMVADEAIGHDWEDLGDGLMICSKNATHDNQEDDAVKSEQGNYPSPSPIHNHQGRTAYVSGNVYARAAYEAINEIEYEVVERPRSTETYHRNHRPHRAHRESASSTKIMRRPAPVGSYQERLQRFRHRAIRDSDESIFKRTGQHMSEAQVLEKEILVHYWSHIVFEADASMSYKNERKGENRRWTFALGNGLVKE